jgi:AAT family amino acid transporter
MGLSSDWNLSWIVGVPWVVGLSLVYFWRKRSGHAAGEVTSSS